MKDVLTYEEFKEQDFSAAYYPFPDEAGAAIARLVLKRLGKENIICYFEGEDGEKFKLAVWWNKLESRAYRPRDSDLDMAEVEIGTEFDVSWDITHSGKARFLAAEPV